MLTWLAVALLTGAAVVAIGWGLRRTDELGRPRRFPWVTVALLLAMGVGAAVPGVLRASQERRLGGAAPAGPSSTPAPSSATSAGGPTGRQSRGPSSSATSATTWPPTSARARTGPPATRSWPSTS